MSRALVMRLTVPESSNFSLSTTSYVNMIVPWKEDLFSQGEITCLGEVIPGKPSCFPERQNLETVYLFDGTT